jgi:hypothetical protein
MNEATIGRDDRGLDRLISDPTAVAQATRATEARGRMGRRRLVDSSTCERDDSAAELEFVQAMQEYKQSSGRGFPTWSEVLEVFQALGYEKAETTAKPVCQSIV